MSEYQRYEFMTCDRPLTKAELKKVDALSSHIEASSTHAVIEYNWGDFKHNPINVLHKYFDGFLYWANWGSPELALRFPHGVLPTDLLDYYELSDVVTFTQHPDYDILDISFGELEGPEEWVDYELALLIGIRNELMEGDLRAFYIIWLAAQNMLRIYNRDEDLEEETSIPPIPSGLGSLTVAQQALAELLQIPSELLTTATKHSRPATANTDEDTSSFVTTLPRERCDEYLVRLIHNEPGLHRKLIKELRELNPDKVKTETAISERIPFATLNAESRALQAKMQRKEHERQQAEHQRHIQEIHDNQETYWQEAEQAVSKKTSSGYDKATNILLELREVAERFQTQQKFQERFTAWVQPHLRRPAFVTRLEKHNFSLP